MSPSIRAVDTNVLLRYLLSDVPELAEQARRLIESETPLGIGPIVLAEVAWTMTGSRLRVPRQEVARVLIDLLARANVAVLGAKKAEVQSALLTVVESGASIGDALVAACARSAGVHEIYTFDRRFGRAGLRPASLP